jgi:acetaldehyde dehydrogenase (acetylating)
VVKNAQEGKGVCRQFLEFGGMGHTMSIHASDDRVIRDFALNLPAFRIVVNTPAAHGSIGLTTKLFPSMSLGCGTPGNNITSDNLSPLHLLNIKRLAYERRPMNRLETVEANAAEAGTASRHYQGRLSTELEPRTSADLLGQGRASNPLPDRADISRLVERFLAVRDQAPTAATPPVLPTSVLGVEAGAIADQSGRGARPSSHHESVSRHPVDFVSEDDVRRAIKKGQKIYVGPGTIITPSARDLGEPVEVFVLTKKT